MINILVFPCGSEIGIEVYNCLHQQKDINLIGASSVEDNGKFFFETYIGDIPFVNDKSFASIVQEIIQKYKIDFIYPTMDVAIKALKEIEPELNCKVLCSPMKTIDVISRKSSTYKFFKNLIRVPEEVDENNPKYPIFSKPDIGSSSRGTLLVDCDIAYAYSKKIYPQNIYMEYLPGKEFTVDCFSDINGKLIFVSARERTRISNGISVGSVLVKDEKITNIANIINNSLPFTGPWFFQLKKDKNQEYCLLEIASRFGGSSVLNRLLGVNFAYLNILKEFGDVSTHTNKYDVEIGRSLNIKTISNIEYDTIYIDYDDTIIINNSVNANAMALLYRCVNKNKKIVLLTKHKGKILESFIKFRINPNLFDSIVQIEKDDDKAKYIDGNAIFVDDSFSERKNIATKLNIPVIGVENIEFI